ncbi:hypothetical protein D3C74_336830 [compost metagenome]
MLISISILKQFLIARYVATKSADELAKPLPSGKSEFISNTPPNGNPSFESIFWASSFDFCLWEGNTIISSNNGTDLKVVTVEFDIGNVTKKL